MSHELICSWLGLPPGEWPPDHYRLLGLEPGESNTELIEQRVHQRLDSVRRYQMMHPEQATEAMNRLAQAFVCLTEPAAKRLYDATLLGKSVGTLEAPLPAEAAPEARDPLAWLYNPAPHGEGATPPPLPSVPPPLPPEWRQAPAPGPPAPERALPAGDQPAVNGGTAHPVAAPDVLPELAPAVVPLPLPPPPAAPELADPVIDAAQSSPPARRGLGTKRALYYRVVRTRQLLRHWTAIGKYLASPRRRLARSSEAADLLQHLLEIQSLLEEFPPLLGEAGQPGYLVLALTQVTIKRTFEGLAVSQREALSRDWQAGLKLLVAHRDFLRGELLAMRTRSFAKRLLRAVRSFLADRPVAALLILLGLLALNVALWQTYFRTP